MRELRIAISEVGGERRGAFVNFVDGHFSGYFKSVIDLIYGWYESPKINRTVVLRENEPFGSYDPVTGQYSGLFGVLQRNQADILLFPNIDFTSVQGNGVIRGQLMECEPPAIISAYDSRINVVKADMLLDTLKDVGQLNLFLFSLSLFILTSLLVANHSNDLKRIPSYYDPVMSVLTYILQRIQIKVFSVKTLIVCICLTLTLFYFVTFFTSVLHVSLVKVNPPIVINTYNDIIDRLDRADTYMNNTGSNNNQKKMNNRFQVAWSHEFPDTELFEKGSEGSKELQIWKKTIEKSKEPFFVRLGLHMLKANEEISPQRMVVILNKGYSYFVRNTLCDVPTNDANVHFYAWISVDKDAKWNQKGFVIRESLDNYLSSFIEERTRRVLESGMIIQLYRQSQYLHINFLPRSKRSNCSSETIMMDDVSLQKENDQGFAIGNEQFEMLYITCLIMSCFSFFALIIEFYLRWKHEQDHIGVWVIQVRTFRVKPV